MKATLPPDALGAREQHILASVVQQFVATTLPVGSKLLSEKGVLGGLSAATIRNSMNQLEEQGYLNHPYTSSGRVPTDQGYRTYVDRLMHPLSVQEQQFIERQLAELSEQQEEWLRESAHLLARLSNLIAIALSPNLSNGILQKIDAVQLSTQKVLFVLNIQDGLVKTIVVGATTDLPQRSLQILMQVLNERLSGLSLAEIRQSIHERLYDVSLNQEVVQLVLGQSEQIFADMPQKHRVQQAGVTRLLQQPEFKDTATLQRLFECLENEALIVHLLESHAQNAKKKENTAISIGTEITEIPFAGISLLSTEYYIGNSKGSIALIGPTRMEYAKAITLLERIAQHLTQKLNA